MADRIAPHPYIPNSAPDVYDAMLADIGATSIEECYADVPAGLRLTEPLDLPPALPAEAELTDHVLGLLRRDRSMRDALSFLGGGTYRHHVPAVVDEVIGRSEFLTAYAGEPYEDHGRFQALFEYTSLMAELLEMDVVNVPTYDGYQAAATSLAMALRATSRGRVLAASDILPSKLTKARDFVRSWGTIEQVPTVDGLADPAAVTAALAAGDVAAVWAESPSALGALDPGLRQLADAAHAAGALLVVGTDPICLGVVRPPATCGADIVCGDIQSLGLHAYYGGAHAGFIAVHDDPALVMELPSRLFGVATTAVSGEWGFGDVAYERTSFARREDGKEWVGTAAALWGIAAGVYLALMGPTGMADIGSTVMARTAYARGALAAIDGITLTDDAAHFREFAISTEVDAARLRDALRARGIEPGIVLDAHRLLVCVTEMTSAADIDRLAREVAAAMRKESAS